MKTERKAIDKHYILSFDNSFYYLSDENERILLRSHYLGVVLQFASYLRKNGYIVNVSDSIRDELGQGGVL